MNARTPTGPELVRGPVRETVARHRDLSAEVSAELRADIAKRKAKLLHEEARGHELTEALGDNANARSGPGHYVAKLDAFTARCGCSAAIVTDCDEDGAWESWKWSDGGCKGLIVTSYNVMWTAVREDYCGAEDSNCPIGSGRTEAAAIADLIEVEQMREDA